MFDQLEQLYKRAFRWETHQLDCVRLVLGCYLAPRAKGKPTPPWAVIQGAPSTGKSTILDMLRGFPYTVSSDHWTKAALTSCYQDENNPNEDHSVLGKLAESRDPKGEKCLVIQELNSFTAGDTRLFEAHLGHLRAASVGRHVSDSGMGGQWVRELGRFGLIIATTEAFETIRERMATFGDRFLVIRWARRASTAVESMAKARMAWACDPVLQERYKEQIRSLTHTLLAQGIQRIKDGPSDLARVGPDADKLALWSALHPAFATGAVRPDMLTTASADPWRIVEQVRTWGNTHAIMDGRDTWGPVEYRVAKRVFQDSMPISHWRALKAIWPNGASLRTGAVDLYRQWGVLGLVETGDGGPIEFHNDRIVRLTPDWNRAITESNYLLED